MNPHSQLINEVTTQGAVEEGGEFRKEVERMRKRVRELEEGRRERGGG